MLTVSDVRVFGIESAIRGMRNPYDSWNKSDSEGDSIGHSDLELACRLVKAGTDHGKLLRMIHVQMDIKAPLYWWKEADTYKIGTVANSCSTMHRIQAKEFTPSDFSCENLDKETMDCLNMVIASLNKSREAYLSTKDKGYWWDMIQLLPTSYNQLRTFDVNYEVLLRMYFSRNGHKLDEWHTMRAEIEKLPYMKEFIEAKQPSV